MPIQQVSEAQFEQEVLRSELPVLVDLYADCEPCKQLEPILEQVAGELEGKLKVVRVDVEHSPMLAQAFRVQSLPMLMLLHQGRPVDQAVGMVDKKAILEMVRPVLPTGSNELQPAELAQLVTQRRVLPVDVRDASAYGRHHIPGAVHIPREELETRVEELRPSDGRLRVLYGRTGDEAKEAAESLKPKGVDVGYLTGGFLHWEADGHEVERGS